MCICSVFYKFFSILLHFLYLASISRPVFAFSSSDLNFLTVILKSVLDLTILILLVSILFYLYLYSHSALNISFEISNLLFSFRVILDFL